LFSKFIPKSTTEITQYILNTIEMDCSENYFRDDAVGAKDFQNKDSELENPMGTN